MSTPPPNHRVVNDAQGRPVLVKSCPAGPGSARLAGEAALLVALDHPGTVRVVEHRSGEVGDELWLAWVGPHSMSTVTGLPVGACGRLMAQIADTVAALHSAGICHRRITADHVLIGAGGRAVLTGFADAAPATPEEVLADIAAIGLVLEQVVAPQEGTFVPDRRRSIGDDGGRRAALLTLADRAQAEPPESRPTAADLAMALATASPASPTRRRRISLPRGRRRPGGRSKQRSTPGRARSSSDRARSSPRARSASRVRSMFRRGRAPSRSVMMGALLSMIVAAVLAAAVWIRPADEVATTGPRRPWANTSGPWTASPDSVASQPPPAETTPSDNTEPEDESETHRPPPPPTTPTSTTSPTEVQPGGRPGPVSDDPCPPPSAVCPREIQVEGRRVFDGATTYVVGQDGDSVLVGDWDCDGTATVASLRPATGEIFIFPTWAEQGREVTVSPHHVIDGAIALRAEPQGECTALFAELEDGSVVPVPMAA